MIAKFLEKAVNAALSRPFPEMDYLSAAWEPALSPMKTELFGLKRNHARDQIRLNELYDEQYRGKSFFLPGRVYAAWLPKTEADLLQEKQDRREARIEQIVAKLERDGRMKGPKH